MSTGLTQAEAAQLAQDVRRGRVWIVLAAALAWPYLVYRLLADVHHSSPVLVAALAGTAILGAAFLLSWAAEAFQLDVSQAMALALLSLIAVLPEYAVDLVFAWRAAADPIACRSPEVLAGLVQMECQAPYAVANMTGSNRLLIGVGWSSVVLLTWWRARRQRASRPVNRQDGQRDGRKMRSAEVAHQAADGTIVLEPGQALELAALGAATLYSFLIPLKGGIGPLDTVVLVSLFAVYIWGTSRAPSGDPHLVGPAASIGVLAPVRRRVVTYGLFAYAALVIFLSAEPFADGLVRSGAALGLDEFLLVQWLAPLASESPEFLVALLFAWRGLAGAGLRTLVASKVNQWTLLIGTLGAAYSIALGAPADLPLDARQTEELFLTSGQSLFALALIANFNLTVREACFLLGAFLIQFVLPGTQVRIVLAALYVVVAVVLMVASPSRREALWRLPAMVRETVAPSKSKSPLHGEVAG